VNTQKAKKYFYKLEKDDKSSITGSTFSLILDDDEALKSFVHKYVIKGSEFREKYWRLSNENLSFYLSPILNLYFKDNISFEGSYQYIKTGVTCEAFFKKLHVYQQLKSMRNL